MSPSPDARPRSSAITVCLALVAISVGGCTTADGPADAGPSAASPPAAADPPSVQRGGEPVSGTGPAGWPGVTFPVADGARSVVVGFACKGGHPFTVELGDSMMLEQAPLDGTCGGVSELAWPVTDLTGSTLNVLIPEDVAWTATPVFSPEPFPTDPLIAIECEAFTLPYSAIVNAESGYTTYEAFDSAEWERRLDGAAERLADLADRSTTELEDSFAQLAAIAAATDRVPGELLTSTQAAVMSISEVCNANQTPFVVMAEFGG